MPENNLKQFIKVYLREGNINAAEALITYGLVSHLLSTEDYNQFQEQLNHLMETIND